MNPIDLRTRRKPVEADPAETQRDLDILAQPDPVKPLPPDHTGRQQFDVFLREASIRKGPVCGFETSVLYKYYLWWREARSPDLAPITPRRFGHLLRRTGFRRTHRIYTHGKERRCYSLAAASVEAVEEFLLDHPMTRDDYEIHRIQHDAETYE